MQSCSTNFHTEDPFVLFATVLVMQSATTSEAMVLTKFSQNILTSATEALMSGMSTVEKWWILNFDHLSEMRLLAKLTDSVQLSCVHFSLIQNYFSFTVKIRLMPYSSLSLQHVWSPYHSTYGASTEGWSERRRWYLQRRRRSICYHDWGTLTTPSHRSKEFDHEMNVKNTWIWYLWLSVRLQ